MNTQVLFTEGLFSAMELGPGFKAPDPNVYDFQASLLQSGVIRERWPIQKQCRGLEINVFIGLKHGKERTVESHLPIGSEISAYE